MSVKIDFKKSMKEFYQPNPKEVVLVDIPEMQFLMIDGLGSPGDSKEYQDALAALYPISFKAKFLSKAKGKDYVVPPLEGLWWADDMKDFIEGKRDKWKWTMMIMQPEWITQDIIIEVLDITNEKKPELSKLLPKLRLEKYKEGKAAQIMHIGPYSEEGPTVQKVHDFIQKVGGKFDGQKNKHHEIYLSDPRKVNPATMKTVIRQPFI
ncbi:MAG: GyrI-like domain-containing protein [Candidatus Lokiarchaeota archaeon]|nr:GyrI-like domain-containing protein [Candidatus Lokiarchaeota archaeon]